MTDYCDVSDVYTWIPPGVVKVRSAIVESVSTSAETMTLDGHGLATDDVVRFRAEAGGSLPSPLSEGTDYYAIRVNESRFQVSASAGGSAVDLTTAGSNILLIPAIPWATWITAASATLDNIMTAHHVPLEETPPIVTDYTAGLVAMKALGWSGTPTTAIEGRLTLVGKQFDKWNRGVPIRGTVKPSSANKAISAGVVATDTRGWVNALGDSYIP